MNIALENIKLNECRKKPGLTLYFVAVVAFLMSSGIFTVFNEGGARNQGVESREDTPIYTKMIWIFLGLVSVLIGWSWITRKTQLKREKIDWCFFSFILVSLAGAVLSENMMKSFSSSISLVSIYIVISRHCADLNGISLIRYLGIMCSLLLYLSLILIFFMPSYGISVGEHTGLWQGAFTHKNQLGAASSLAFSLFLSQLDTKRSVWIYASLLCSVILLIGSRSSTGIGVAGISFILFVAMKIRWINDFLCKYKYWTSISLICSAVFFAPLCLFLEVAFFEGFTGRDFIWAMAIQESMRSPIIGNGLGVFNPIDLGDISVGSSHNGYIQLFYSSGLIGVFLVCYMLFHTLTASSSVPWKSRLLIITPFLAVNIFESSLISLCLCFSVIVYLFCMSRKNEPLHPSENNR